MKKAILVGLLALLIPAGAFGATALSTGTLNITNSASTNKFNILEGVALNAGASTRTIELNLGRRWAQLNIYVDLTRSASTDVQTTFECSPHKQQTSESSITYFLKQAREIAVGVATTSNFSDVHPGTVSVALYWEYGVRTCETVRMVFSGTAADGSDLIDVRAVAVVGD